MATVIKKFSKTWSGRYPWPLWTNGRKWRAVQGVDFVCSKRMFILGLYKRAKSQPGIERVEIPRVDEEKIVEFRFFRKKTGKRK